MRFTARAVSSPIQFSLWNAILITRRAFLFLGKTKRTQNLKERCGKHTMVHNAPKSTGKAKNTSNRRQRIGKGKAGGKNWLKNGNPPGDPRNAPRCGAKTRSGKPCQAPGMANGRCRMHGGASTGPRTAEGLANSRRSRRDLGSHLGKRLSSSICRTKFQRLRYLA